MASVYRTGIVFACDPRSAQIIDTSYEGIAHRIEALFSLEQAHNKCRKLADHAHEHTTQIIF